MSLLQLFNSVFRIHLSEFNLAKEIDVGHFSISNL